MKNLIISVSFVFSISALAATGLLLYEHYFKLYPGVYRQLERGYLIEVEEGDQIFVTAYLAKREGLYELHETDFSSKFKESDAYMKIMLMHPTDNIAEHCVNNWVTVTGVATFNFMGDSMDKIKSFTNALTGENCFVKHLGVLNYSAKLSKEYSNEK